MSASIKKLLLISLYLFTGATTFSQLIVNPAATPQALAQKLVGGGVTISNVGFRGNLQMTGFFNNIGGTNINIDSGIVLTCGRAKSSPGVGVDGPASAGASQSWGLPGDVDLNAAIGGGTHDACILEFDFIPLGDSIKFNYVFSSEEYIPGWVCTFNDAFAFFISGPGITGLRNIALVPGTSTPVSIFNVNNVPGGGCPNNPSYYINNIGNNYFTHTGHTVVFRAEEKVRPCEKYHLKLVIADVGDFVVDTGVFIEAGSLSSNVVSMGNAAQTDPVSGFSYLVEGCVSGSFEVRRPRKEPAPLVVNLSYGGTATNGVDVLTLPTSVIIPANDSVVTVNVDQLIDLLPEGIETLKIYALGGCASAMPTDSTVIEIRDYDILPMTPDTVVVCRDGSLQLQAPVGYGSYQWLPDPTLSNTNIRDPIATPVNQNTTYTCTATTGTCSSRDSIFLKWKDDMLLISKTDVNCKNAATGQIVVAGGPEWVAPVQFSLDGTNWQSAGTFNNIPVGDYWIKIQDATCIDSVFVSVVQAFPDLLITNLATTPAGCSGGPDGSIIVTAGGGNSSYMYSIDGTNFQASNLFNVVAGSYTITIQDGNGCQASLGAPPILLNDTVTVNAGPDATICEGTSYLMAAVANGNTYSWSPAATLDNAAIKNPTASPVTNTKYYLTATLGICSHIDSVEVFIRPAPIPDAGADIDVCYGKILQLQGNGGTNYQWSPATYFISPTTTQNPDVKATADITYSLMVTDAFGCHSLITDEVAINVTPAFKVFAGNDTIAAVNQPIQLLAKEIGNAGVTSWTWSPAFNLSNPNSVSPVATLTADQRYIVTGTAPGGCQAMDDVLVKVYVGPDIYVPTAFTPNNDGLNDILGPIPVGIKEFKFFRVFNRWGQIVFSTNDPKRGWNGKVNGMPVSTTTFTWMAEAIDYKGNLITRKGVVTIIQ